MKIEGLDELIKKLKNAANGGLKEQMALWLEAMGMEFLDIVQEEIIRTETVDFRNLLNSFKKGDSENVFELKSGGLALHIGTNLEYASFANDGHFTIDPSKNQDRRWVPGRWKGERFEYDPSADTGMLIKFQWVDGTGYWDNALAIFEKMFTKSLEKKVQQWLDTF
ncbi:HK97 gp10 family phage protein [Heyndrickxia oleronia]|uniref:HK97 gp10 family phage protein n=1 Tax=Heyndrickxia oleronia TaxID=38875 RepID=UPI00203F422B|nr:HK97 gp10 family phage protein [Heyndrickxia oleronia]MCM3452738.1 HK97 gp10 family phage protein [Heyndrickxia oleronia]